MKKKFLWLGLSFLLVAALVLASCGEAAPGEQEEEEEEEEEEAFSPYGGTLTVMTGGHQFTDAPALGIMDANYFSLLWLDWIQEVPLVGDTVKYGPRGTGESNFHTYGHISSDYLKGLLLESWELSLEEAVFHVRPGIYWAADNVDFMENREFTAQDMAADMRLFAFESPWKGRFEGMISDITATDRYTVVIEFETYVHTFLYFLGYEDRAKIGPPETEIAGASNWENQVGTGPFMLEKYVIGSHGSFIRNPNYWDTTTIDGVTYELPFVDKVIVPIIPDESTRIAALTTGTTDIFRGVPVTHWDALDTTVPDLEKVTYSIGGVSRVVMRVDIPPFDNVEVRRAMMIGLDLRKFMELVRAPTEPLHVWPVHPDHSTYIPLDELPADIKMLYDYNPTLAKQMIIDAGFPNDIKTTYLHTADPMAENQAALLKDMWEEIGVTVDIEVVDSVTWADLVYPFPAPKWEGMRPDGTMTSDPSIILGAVMKTGDAWNYSMYSNPVMDELNRKASLEMDIEARNALFSEGLDITMREVASIPLASAPGRAYWWPWIRNYYGERALDDSGTPGIFLAHAWLDQAMKADMGY